MFDYLSNLWNSVSGYWDPTQNVHNQMNTYGMPAYATSGYGASVQQQQNQLANAQNPQAGGFLSNANSIVSMGTSLFNAWNALQQRKLQQQALDQAKRQYLFNVNAYNQAGRLNAQTYNQALTDKYLGRYSYAGKSESDARNQANKDKINWSNVAG